MSTYKAKAKEAIKNRILPRKLLSTSALVAAGALAFMPQAANAGDGPIGDYDVWEFQNTQAVESSQGYVKYKADRIVDNLIQEDIGKLGHVDIDARLTVATGVESGVMHILGKLTSTGQVFVLDVNGFLFGEGSVVDTAGFAAITGTLADTSSLDDGRLEFNVEEGGEITIEQGAMIDVGEAGLAAFVAPYVSNAGIINAKMGTVALAAGETVTVDMYGDGLVELAVEGELGDALLENTGTISAEGGTVQMTALAAKDVVDNIINVDGVVTVASAEVQGGKIILSGGDKGAVSVSGKLDASGTDGGSVDITGQNIHVADTAVLDVDGGQGEDGFGDGGQVLAIAEDHMDFRGMILGRGGVNGGNGGFAEVSGYGALGYSGVADLSAARGELGTLLLDPLFAIIHSGAIDNPLGFNYVIASWALANSLANGNVVIQASEFIDVGTKLDGYSTGNAILDAVLNFLIGTGDIDVSVGDVTTQTIIGYQYNGPGQGQQNPCAAAGQHCTPIYGPSTTAPGITSGSLTLDSAIVNFNKNLIMGTGDVIVDAQTANLDGLIYGVETMGGPQNLLGDARLIGVQGLTTINVLSNNALIQQAIRFADSTAQKLITVAEDTYTEDLLINKSNLKLEGNDATLQSAGGASLITVTADDVNIDPFVFDGGGVADYGINATGADNLIIDGNTFLGFQLSNINVSDSSGVRIFGNTMTGAQKGVQADNTSDIWVHTNIINDATVAGVHVSNTHGTNYTNDIDVWNNQINSAATATGVLIENSNFATVGAHLTNQPNANDALNGNVITGGENGIVVRNSDNAMVRHNEVSGQMGGDGPASGDGIYVADSSHVTIFDNYVHDVEDEGIQGDNADNALVDGNLIEDAGRAGISLMRGSDNQTISNNEINRTGHSGIFSSGKGTLNITGNIITDVGSDHGGNNFRNDGIHVDGAFAGEGNSTSATPFELGGLIDDNTIDGFTHAGIELVNVDSGLTVSDNTIGSTTGGPIGIYNNGSDNTVIDTNTISNVGTGVLVNPSFDVDVINNVIDSVTIGVQLVNSSDILVKDNTISNTSNDGVEVNGGTNNEVISNDIYNIGWDGIQFNGSTNGKIKWNNIDNVYGASGIAVMGGSHGTLIHRNWIDDVDRLGIYVWNSNNQQIQYNDIDNTGREGGNNWFLSGIHLEGSNNSTIYKNDIDTTGGNGIQIGGQGNSAAVATTGNKVLGNEVGLDAGDENINGDGVLLVQANNSEVKWNKITNTNSTGFDIGSGVQSIASNNVVIYDNNIWDTDWDGVRVDGGNNVLVKKNNISHVQRTGIYADSLTNSKIVENDIWNAKDYYGIHVHQGNNILVDDNEIDHTEIDGIYAYQVGQLDIRNNDIGEDGGSNNIGRHGIYVSGSNGAVIYNNDVTQTQGVGVLVNPSDDVKISYNDIWNTDDDGIRVEGGDRADIWENDIWNTGGDGIDVDDNDRVEIWKNDIDNTEGTGIEVSDSYKARIKWNDIDETDEDGINVQNSNEAHIHGNEINKHDSGANTQGDGIEVGNSYKVLVDYNTVDDAKKNGIYVWNSNKADIKGNTVEDTDKNGIYLSNSDYAEIKSNDIDRVGENGIKVNPSDYVDIAYNEIHDAAWDGVLVDNGYGADIWDNHVHRVGRDGIDVNNNNYVEIWDNYIKDTGDNGIEVSDSYDAVIKYNDIEKTDGNGIYVEDSNSAYIKGNEINNADKNGIYVNSSDWAQVLNNDIWDVDENGIKVNPSNYIDIAYNEIHDAAWDGILVDNGYGAWIWDNHVGRVGRDGIDVNSNDDVKIWDNYIHNTGDNGIEVSHSDHALIKKNDITGAGNDGINVYGGHGVDILYNDIFAKGGDSKYDWGQKGAKRDGIHVENSKYVDIIGNDIEADLGKKHSQEGAGRHGIYVKGSDYAEIKYNDIMGDSFYHWSVNSTGEDGIHVYDSYKVDIVKNDVERTGEHGIYGKYIDKADIIGNDVYKAGADGIHVEKSDWVDILWNKVLKSRYDGIDLSRSKGSDINHNIVKYNGDNGIEVTDSSHIDINWNYVKGNDGAGIFVDPSWFIDVIGNTVKDNFIGIHFDDVTFGRIKHNTVEDNFIGVKLEKSHKIEVAHNMIADNHVGLWAYGGHNGYIKVRNNIFLDNPIHAIFNSGLIDLSGEDNGNEFYGGETALYFDAWKNQPWRLWLVDDDAPGFQTIADTGYFPAVAPSNYGGTIGYQYFDGQSENFVKVGSNTFVDKGGNAIWLNALNSTYVTPFGIVQPSASPVPNALTQDIFDFLEGKFFHYPDVNNRGVFFFGFVPDDAQTLENIEDFFNQFDPFAGALSGLNVTLLGLPPIGPVGGGPLSLANIEPAAGGEGGDNPEDLANIEPASGEEDAPCWTSALNAVGQGQTVNYSFGSGLDDALNGAAACGGNI